MFTNSMKSTCIQVLVATIISAHPLFSGNIVRSHSELTGVSWYLTELNHSVENLGGEWYQIRFIDDTIAQCIMSCNTSTFRYSAEGASISFIFRNTSLRYCAVTRDGEFINAMGRVKRKITAGHSIYLLDDTDTLLSLINTPKTPLSGTTWILEELDHSSDNIAGYWLAFSTDTLARTHMHCNSCSYRYTVNGDSIAFAGKGCTMVACMPANREGSFENAMNQVTRWNRSGTCLHLMDANDTLMTYIDSAVFDLIRQPWILHSFQKDSSHTIIGEPERYALTFMADGMVRVVSDCNTCSGSYSEDMGISQLFFSQLACTKVNCGPESHDIAYTSLLKTVNGCRIRSDTLLCFSTVPLGTLWFTKAPSLIGLSPSPQSVATRCSGVSIFQKNHRIVIASQKGSIINAQLINARGVCVRKMDRIADNRVTIGMARLPAGVYLLLVAGRTGEISARSVYLAR